MHDREQNIAALYCSTSDVAFGPLFNDGDFQDCYERAEAFLRWIIVDPREYDQSQLVGCYSEWLAQEEEQYKRENPPRCYDCGEPVGACGDDCPSKVKA